MKKEYTADERCNLIDRVAAYFSERYDDAWRHENVGTGLAYLFWAIADRHDPAPLNLTGEFATTYRAIIAALRDKTELWQELLDGGFIAVDRAER